MSSRFETHTMLRYLPAGLSVCFTPTAGCEAPPPEGTNCSGAGHVRQGMWGRARGAGYVEHSKYPGHSNTDREPSPTHRSGAPPLL